MCVTITSEGPNLDLRSVPTVLSREGFLSNHRCDTRLLGFCCCCCCWGFFFGGGSFFWGGGGLFEGSSQLIDFYDKHGN